MVFHYLWLLNIKLCDIGSNSMVQPDSFFPPDCMYITNSEAQSNLKEHEIKTLLIRGTLQVLLSEGTLSPPCLHWCVWSGCMLNASIPAGVLNTTNANLNCANSFVSSFWENMQCMTMSCIACQKEDLNSNGKLSILIQFSSVKLFAMINVWGSAVASRAGGEDRVCVCSCNEEQHMNPAQVLLQARRQGRLRSSVSATAGDRQEVEPE